MKHADPNLLRKVRQAQTSKAQELYLARGKHKVMKSAFRGIVSYPQRKILYEVGQHGR